MEERLEGGQKEKKGECFFLLVSQAHVNYRKQLLKTENHSDSIFRLCGHASKKGNSWQHRSATIKPILVPVHELDTQQGGR